MSSKQDEIQSAVEKIVGHKLDSLLVVAMNEDGVEIKAGKGEIAAIALLLAELFEDHPELEGMIQTAKKLNKGKLPDSIVEALFKALGGNQNE